MKADKGMTGDAAESHDHSRMLNRIVGIEKSGSHDTHVISLTEAQQLLNALGINQLRIIV